MPSINADVSHSLGKDEAIERLKSFGENIREKYKDQVSDLEDSWAGDTLNFSFKSFGFKVSGTIEVGEDSVTLNGKLPIAAMVFKGKIQQEFVEQLNKILG